MAVSLEGLRLLIVDDDEDLREILVESFEAMDATVESTSSGRKALGLFREDPSRFDIVVSDMRMPDGDGLELARGIKVTALETGQRDAFGRQRPIFVIYSGFNDLKPKDCEEANISLVRPKPMSLDELASELVRMLSSRQAV